MGVEVNHEPPLEVSNLYASSQEPGSRECLDISSSILEKIQLFPFPSRIDKDPYVGIRMTYINSYINA
jgi:hypothetical protein